jgi:arylsulfatase A-like enzyme
LPGLYENNKIIVKEGYLTDVLTERAVKYLTTKHQQPFFLSLQFNAPHWPWQAPGDEPYPDSTRWIVGGTPAIYSAMVKSLDDAVGNILKAIDEAGLRNNTVIIFTSDNGGEKFSDMGIYTGRKAQVWEGGVRVPAIIRWPGHIRENAITAQLAITMDWTASILALAGANAHPEFPLDGTDLIPVCTGKQKTFDRCFYWRMSQEKPQKAIRDGKWKYIQDESGEYLFDLAADPAEKNDLKHKFAKEFMLLKTKYERWEKEVLTPVPL